MPNINDCLRIASNRFYNSAIECYLQFRPWDKDYVFSYWNPLRRLSFQRVAWNLTREL